MDLLTLFGRDEDHGLVWRFQRVGEAEIVPAGDALEIFRRDVMRALARTEAVGLGHITFRLHAERHLALAAATQFLDERIIHRRAVKAGGREFIEEYVALFQRHQPRFPGLGYRRFFG